MLILYSVALSLPHLVEFLPSYSNSDSCKEKKARRLKKRLNRKEREKESWKFVLHLRKKWRVRYEDILWFLTNWTSERIRIRIRESESSSTYRHWGIFQRAVESGKWGWEWQWSYHCHIRGSYKSLQIWNGKYSIVTFRLFYISRFSYHLICPLPLKS